MNATQEERRKAKAKRKREFRKGLHKEIVAKAKARDAEEAHARKVETDNFYKATFGKTYDDLLAAIGRRAEGRRIVRI